MREVWKLNLKRKGSSKVVQKFSLGAYYLEDAKGKDYKDDYGTPFTCILIIAKFPHIHLSSYSCFTFNLWFHNWIAASNRCPILLIFHSRYISQTLSSKFLSNLNGLPKIAGLGSPLISMVHLKALVSTYENLSSILVVHLKVMRSNYPLTKFNLQERSKNFTPYEKGHSMWFKSSAQKQLFRGCLRERTIETVEHLSPMSLL